MPEMFRLDKQNAADHNPQRGRSSRRAPSNIPYVLDNLWEWKRPENYPSRRHCVCVSPTEELARAAGGAADGRVFRVSKIIDEEECIGYASVSVAQIPQKDAKLHPDVIGRESPAKLLMKLLDPAWVSRSAKSKKEISLLWTPCITQGEVDDLFKHELLRDFRDQIWDSIKFWDDVRMVRADEPWPYPEGEGFFVADLWTLT